MTDPIVRKKTGSGFVYFLDGEKITDKSQLHRIKSLAIPPSWQNVKIARSPRTKLQATGYDKAGRKQAIYSEAWRKKQEAEKFARILSFAERLPKMREQLERDLALPGLPKEKVLACIVRLMDEAHFRVGNDTYARENHTYGITTLRQKHTKVRGDTVVFDFIGKSDQKQHKKVSDRKIARIVRKLEELPGYEIFQYVDESGETYRLHAEDVNEYIKQHMGEDYTAKDFRTWAGTLLMAAELAQNEHHDTEKDRNKAVTACIKTVAKELGNTPAVTRGSYVDPRIIAAYHNGDGLSGLKKATASMKPEKYRRPEEVCLVNLLQKTT